MYVGRAIIIIILYYAKWQQIRHIRNQNKQDKTHYKLWNADQ